MSHVLYRFFNADDELLYVGITCDPLSRFGAHRYEKSWWPEVATIKVENYASRGELRDAERAIVKAEKPRYNAHYNNAGQYVLVEYDGPEQYDSVWEPVMAHALANLMGRTA